MDERIADLEDALSLAERHDVRGERVAEARVSLEELHTQQRRKQAELVRSTAALEAAVDLDDEMLLKSALAAARAAGGAAELLALGAERLEELEELERLRREEAEAARLEAEERARAQAAALEALRSATDRDESGPLESALELAEACGLQGHVVWMAEQALNKQWTVPPSQVGPTSLRPRAACIPRHAIPSQKWVLIIMPCI